MFEVVVVVGHYSCRSASRADREQGIEKHTLACTKQKLMSFATGRLLPASGQPVEHPARG
jgi:hypothetical protein